MTKDDAILIMGDINAINAAIEAALQRMAPYPNADDLVVVKQALCMLTFDVDSKLVRPIVAQYPDLDPRAEWNALQDAAKSRR
jgi:cob(I)alamin adenosyltransferase